MRQAGERGPSTSDSDSAGQHRDIRQIQNLKLKMRPSSRQNFKISRPQSRQAQQRRLSPRELSPKKKTMSGTESGHRIGSFYI